MSKQSSVTSQSVIKSRSAIEFNIYIHMQYIIFKRLCDFYEDLDLPLTPTIFNGSEQYLELELSDTPT